MATLVISDNINLSSSDLWVSNPSVSASEAFTGQISSTGNPLIGQQTVVYSGFTFTVGDLRYTYHGEWTVQYDRGVVLGTARASGYYDEIEITRNGNRVAHFEGPAMSVDFGQTQSLPLVDLVLGTVLQLLLGQAEQNGDGVENLHLDATPGLPVIAFSGADSLTGGGGDNHLQGHAGHDRLYGLAGNDTLDGGAGNDSLYGGLGADHHIGGAGIDYARYDDANYGDLRISLTNPSINTGAAAGDTYESIEGVIAGAGNDIVYGDSGNNYLYGLAGNDTLFGGLGADRLDGGAGIDYARYDDANYGNLVISLANPSQNTGAAAGDTYNSIEGIIGGVGNDRIGGNAFVNYLYGGAGNDILAGNGGNDTLAGGPGQDAFVFNTALDEVNNVDRIVDFNVADDTIWLENSIFLGIGANNTTLAAARFHIGAEATTASHRIIYNQTTGELFYDADGNGAGAAVKFAQLSTDLSMTANDFLVI